MPFVVSDTHVAPLYLDRAMESLLKAGYRASSFVFEAGEASKTLQTYAACQSAMAEAALTRSSVVVALGGGVVGDLAGFAAATYMRGCSCIQVPTSLLSCVDSSVGGKTAVDLPEGKNLVGAFFQPDAVLIDTSLLETLPRRLLYRRLRRGSEIRRYRRRGSFFLAGRAACPQDLPLKRGHSTLRRNQARYRSGRRIRTGSQAASNFGHTLGHAIEKCSISKSPMDTPWHAAWPSLFEHARCAAYATNRSPIACSPPCAPTVFPAKRNSILPCCIKRRFLTRSAKATAYRSFSCGV